jgi:hypothetical protein
MNGTSDSTFELGGADSLEISRLYRTVRLRPEKLLFQSTSRLAKME